jgi:hypothetical protein
MANSHGCTSERPSADVKVYCWYKNQNAVNNLTAELVLGAKFLASFL